MVNATAGFLELPPRSGKPRRTGITHVLDKGLPVRETESLLEVTGGYVDVWKFGWGTAYLDLGLKAKLAVLERHGILACTGGTLLEVAWHQGVVQRYLDWAEAAGFPCVEVSCGVITLTSDQRRSLVEQAAQRFTVLGEVGVKDPRADVVANAWAQDAREILAAGATWVVTEGRESGTVGLYEPDGRVRSEVVDSVVGAIGADATIFEAPHKEQQAWLIRRFGADVNLANIPPAEVLGLEALRLGLRADTFDPSSMERSR
ncbi:MAG TPA: phosphosulfolactate synthase [Jiangellaceae bacterium]|nr:phosphosulfolactate synthase [Jiangellaceae bacterium]